MVSGSDQDLVCFNTITSIKAQAKTKMKTMGVTNVGISDEDEVTDVGRIDRI